MNEYIDILIAIIITCGTTGFILGIVMFIVSICEEIKNYLEDN